MVSILEKTSEKQILRKITPDIKKHIYCTVWKINIINVNY